MVSGSETTTQEIWDMASLRDLIDMLEEAAVELGDDAEVRLMTQHNWPFEYSIFGLARGEDINASEDDDDDDVEDDNVLYIVEGTQLGYGSKRAWEVATQL